ncbi:MAG: carotenoid biosynthesis protein [Candidatus Marinimicrobia bacterium]|nr:carotenoid biosynthesis protein [Candidatus Neomarinimicrobiota bacterium]
MEISLKNRRMRITPERLRIAFIYLILLAGALWHTLGLFQHTMEVLAAPIIIGVGAWLFLEYVFQLEHTEKVAFSVWGGSVLFLSLLIEWIGVETGWLFGHYNYGEVLKPQIAGVPLAIGFAWLGMLIASVAFVQRVMKLHTKRRILIASLLTGLLMVSFDVFLEPAAVKLEYWFWIEGFVPFSNYITWFVASVIFAYVGFRNRVFPKEIPPIAMHAYVAQLLYFIFTNMGIS